LLFLLVASALHEYRRWNPLPLPCQFRRTRHLHHLVRWRYERTRRIEGLDLGRVPRRCARASRVPSHRPAL